jgi:hypothetical protein
MNADDRTLDCGHKPSPHSPHATGTAHFDGREICWDCANVEEKRHIANSAKCMGYLDLKSRRVTTWTGHELGKVTGHTSHWHNMAGTLHYISVEMFDGSHWYGTSPGDGMYCRLRRRAVKPEKIGRTLIGDLVDAGNAPHQAAEMIH